MNINLNNKKFKALQNSETGEVSEQTIFHYHQDGDVVWASYSGGDILKGNLVGKIVAKSIVFTYQHLNIHMELMTGKCESHPQINSEGKIKLLEQWQWTCKDFSKGTSVLVEV